MAEKILHVNVSTGEAELRDATAEELARLQDDRAAFAVEVDREAAELGNAGTLRDRAAAALENMEAAWNGWAGLTAAQKDAAAKLNLRVTIALVRLVLRRLDKT